MAPRKTDFCTCQRSTLRKECSRQSRLIAAVGKISQRYSTAGFDEHNIGKQVKLCSGAVAGRVNQNAELKPLWWTGWCISRHRCTRLIRAYLEGVAEWVDHARGNCKYDLQILTIDACLGYFEIVPLFFLWHPAVVVGWWQNMVEGGGGQEGMG